MSSHGRAVKIELGGGVEMNKKYLAEREQFTKCSFLLTFFNIVPRS